MPSRLLLTMLLWMTSTVLWAGNIIFSPRIRTLTSTVNGEWTDRPVMTMGRHEVLTVGFDELSHEYHRMVYHLEHCEADWTVSEGIFEGDWLTGFNDIPIDDYQNSINTTVEYTHYQFTIPNDRCRLHMSGNYRLTVFEDDGSSDKLLQVEFYVVEPLMSVGLEMTTNTDIDHNLSHQQLAMTVGYNDLRVTDADNQLRTVVMQNWREDNARYNLPPTYVNSKGMVWEHNRQLIFDGGNEYHKFEMLDVSHATMGLDRITWDGHHYQAYPFAAVPRRNYLTDHDADGAFLIRNSDRTESDYTCDYILVNYTLEAPYSGELFISGQWCTDHDRETYRMRYDNRRHCYYTQLLQKQGYYNYQYLTPDGGIPPSEGNFFQTGNRYQALVYYREPGGRTWRLVGYRALVTGAQ